MLTTTFSPEVLPVDDTLELQRTRLADATEGYAMINENRDHLRAGGEYLLADQTLPAVLGDLEGMQRLMLSGSALDYWVCREGQKVGAISMLMMPTVGSLNYWLTKDATGQGLATRAARRLVQHSFSVRPLLQTVQLSILPENTASQRVAERLGAKWVATLSGEGRKLNLFGIARHE